MLPDDETALMGVGGLAAASLLSQAGDQADPGGPTAAFTVSQDGSETFVHCDGSASSAPEGIAEWRWRPLVNGGEINPTKYGQQVTFERDTDLSPGSYGLELQVTDSEGNTATARDPDAFSLAFEDPGGGSDPFDSTITLSIPSGEPYSSVDWSLSVTGELQSDHGHAGTQADGVLGNAVEIEYSGEISTFDWSGGPISAWQDGTRIDPYSLTRWGGPRRRSDSGGDMLEVTIYQTRSLWISDGYAPARNVADWLAGMLDAHGVSYDILWRLPVMDSESNKVSCHNPFQGEEVCEDSDCSDVPCCTRRGLRPGAIYFWANHAGGSYPSIESDWQALTGDTSAMSGPATTLRKDSNLLLTDREAGGCGQVGGMFCVAGGARAASAPDYYSGAALSDTWASGIHDAVHEIAHNFGFAHPANSCDGGGGEGWVDSSGRWHRTPCVPGDGCTNECGTWIPYRENAHSTEVVRHLRFTECSVDQFLADADGEQGQVQATVSGSNAKWRDRGPRRVRVRDCSSCFDRDLETLGHAHDCECGGACGCERARKAADWRHNRLESGRTY